VECLGFTCCKKKKKNCICNSFYIFESNKLKKKQKKAQIHTFKRNLSSTLVSHNQSDDVFLVDAQFKSYNASCNLIKDTFSVFTNRTTEFAATEQFFCEANKMNDAFTLNKDALLYDVSVGLRKINKKIDLHMMTK